MRKAFWIIATTIFFVEAVFAQQKTIPRFEDFPVNERFYGRSVAPKLTSPRARTFRTRIKTQTKAGPNFAGHYTITSWGCGTMSCTSFAIVDNRTGKVYFPLGDSIILASIYQTEYTVDFQKNSRLLIVTGAIVTEPRGDSIGKHYYVWKNNRLKLVRFIPDNKVHNRGGI